MLTTSQTTSPTKTPSTVTLTETAGPQEKGCVDVEAVTLPVPEQELIALSKTRKFLVLLVLCSAQFFDIFNATAAIIALPSMGVDLGFTHASLQWVLSAFTLTFASFMLISGSISDIFHPKPVFTAGFAVIGLFSIPVAASVHPIMTIVFRALQGIGAAMNVPSAVAMISTTFPDPIEQSSAYALYALAGSVGNVSGFVIGGVLTAWTSWRWVHYLIAIIIIPTSALSCIDFPGALTLTAGLILFVYAISDGADVGWSSPQVISTLALSVLSVIAFFIIEHIAKNPALPPATWSNKNFISLFFYAWSPYWWGFGCELQLVGIFMDLWHQSALSAAVRCIPMGFAGGISSWLAGKFGPLLPPSALLVGGQALMAVGAVLFALADTIDKYWSHIFPGMVVGMTGLGGAYVACTTMVMGGARKGEEGIVGAVMYTAYQVGSTLGLAIVTSIAVGVNSGLPQDPVSQYEGYAAAFWSMAALPGVMMLITLLFVRR
ncbi:hypothetical protein ONZ45_g3099 [Pleurotus djamor]|nr:hypothetical protein ONZ45_g3099 [Pleurotus djamor]